MIVWVYKVVIISSWALVGALVVYSDNDDAAIQTNMVYLFNT